MVVFIVCCVVLLVPSNPRLLFNVWLLVVVAVGVRGLLCVCVFVVFVCVLFDCLFVRFLIIESRSKFVSHPDVLCMCRCVLVLLLLLVLWVVRFVVVVVVVCCVLLLVVSNQRVFFNRVLFVVVGGLLL